MFFDIFHKKDSIQKYHILLHLHLSNSINPTNYADTKTNKQKLVYACIWRTKFFGKYSIYKEEIPSVQNTKLLYFQ